MPAKANAARTAKAASVAIFNMIVLLEFRLDLTRDRLYAQRGGPRPRSGRRRSLREIWIERDRKTFVADLWKEGAQIVESVSPRTGRLDGVSCKSLGDPSEMQQVGSCW
jgi:hypothetical protein